METEKSIEPTNTAEENDLTKRIEAILADLKKHLADKTDSATNPEQQELVGRLINLLPYLEHLKNSRINVGQAEAAAAALNSTPQHLELAKTIIVQLEKRKDIYRSVFLSVWEGRSVAAQLLLGVACHVILLIFIVMSFPKMHESLGDIEPMLIWVFVGGALGGITSLLVRLHDFAVIGALGSGNRSENFILYGSAETCHRHSICLICLVGFQLGIVKSEFTHSGAEYITLLLCALFHCGF